jgi:sugar lactone lactonase YvrE
MRLLVPLFTLAVSPLLHAQEMQYPLDVVEKDEQTFYVADRNLPGVWVVTDGKAEIFFQGSKKFRTPLNAIRCLAVDEKGHLLAGDSSTRDIYRFNEKGEPTPLTDGHIGIPMSIVVAKSGDIYVADLELHRIWKVPSAGGKPEEVAVVAAPRGLAIDSEGKLWIVSHGPNQVLKLNPEDGSIETIVKGMPFQFAHQIVLKNDTNGYVVDGYAKTIWKVEPGKDPEKLVAGEPLKNPVGLSLTKDGLLVADPHKKAIYFVAKDGTIVPRYPASQNSN